MVVVHYTIESYWIYRKDTLDKLDRTGYWKDTQEGILWEVHTGPSGYWKVSLLLYSLLKYVKLVLSGLLETRDIKLINGLMIQFFFRKIQINGLLQQKFQKLTPIIILKSERWQLSIWLAKNKIFCQFWSHKFPVW